MTPLKVALIADLLEERWPSMDLVADMLMKQLRNTHAGQVEATLVRPRMRTRATAIPVVRSRAAAFTIDRFTNRLWDYPRIARKLASSFDVFHVVDHSYAQIVHALPAERTLVTCHDLDTFRSVLDPELDPRSAPFRAMTRHILEGLKKAAHIACDTEATRDALLEKAHVDPSRTSVVPNGPHPSCTPQPEPFADREAGRLLGPAGRHVELLHVGSTIARKRIDVLLHVVAALRRQRPGLRLVRVGGPFTAAQRALVRDLDLDDAIVVLPFLDRSTLAAVYRRSALVLLPSEREGFGLPVLEALACGTPIVASDIEPLREVGGDAVEYCAPEDVDAWTVSILRVLAESTDRDRAQARRAAGIARASSFSWNHYAADVAALYARIAASVDSVQAGVVR
jgi:glycosyltransferase involved in cell wall biosynthesis